MATEFETEVQGIMDTIRSIMKLCYKPDSGAVRAIVMGVINATVGDRNAATPSAKVESVKAALEAADRIINDLPA